MRCLKFLVIFLVVPVFANAGYISGVSGTVSQGGSITISASGGTGFGSGDSTPLFYDDFEDGTPSASIGDPKIGSWIDDSDAVYSTSDAISGSQSRYDATCASTSCGIIQMDDFTGDKYYMSWWIRTNDANINYKIFQIWGNCGDPDFSNCTSPACGDYSPIIIWTEQGDWSFCYITTDQITSAIGDCSDQSNIDPDMDITDGNWHFIEAIVEQSSPDTADGNVTIRADGVTRWERLNTPTRYQSIAHWSRFILGEGTFTGTSTPVWVDDAYLNDSWARIAIGASQTYSDNTVLSIFPASSWADGLVTASANVGQFTGTAYLWVIDADNTPSDQDEGTAGYQGFEITIGESPSGGSSTLSGCIISGGIQ